MSGFIVRNKEGVFISIFVETFCFVFMSVEEFKGIGSKGEIEVEIE